MLFLKTISLLAVWAFVVWHLTKVYVRALERLERSSSKMRVLLLIATYGIFAGVVLSPGFAVSLFPTWRVAFASDDLYFAVFLAVYVLFLLPSGYRFYRLYPGLAKRPE